MDVTKSCVLQNLPNKPARYAETFFGGIGRPKKERSFGTTIGRTGLEVEVDERNEDFTHRQDDKVDLEVVALVAVVVVDDDDDDDEMGTNEMEDKGDEDDDTEERVEEEEQCKRVSSTGKGLKGGSLISFPSRGLRKIHSSVRGSITIWCRNVLSAR